MIWKFLHLFAKMQIYIRKKACTSVKKETFNLGNQEIVKSSSCNQSFLDPRCGLLLHRETSQLIAQAELSSFNNLQSCKMW